MGIVEMLDPINITVLTYYRDKDTKDIEVFWLWHGAEHRMAQLIEEWGDISNWEHDLENGEVTARNNDMGAIIKLRKRKVQEGGNKS